MKNCLFCNISFFCSKRKFLLERTKYCSRNCLYEHMKIINSTEKVVVSCSLCGKAKSIIKNGEKHRNNKNFFCDRKCAYEARKIDKFKHFPSDEQKRVISKTRKEDWKNGVYNKVEANKAKWISHIKKDGSIVRCQGNWEKQYAEWLDKNNIEYISHPNAIYYIDKNGDQRLYFPDFFLLQDNVYIDIKNSYLYSLSLDKFDAIIASNPGKKIKVLLERDLLKIGIIPRGINKKFIEE